MVKDEGQKESFCLKRPLAEVWLTSWAKSVCTTSEAPNCFQGVVGFLIFLIDLEIFSLAT